MRMLQTSVVGLLGASMCLGLVGTPAVAETKHIKLSGFDEVPVVITDATGTFRGRIAHDGGSIEYVLTYEGVVGDVLQAHIHLGQTHTAGAIVVFLCTNLGNAPPSVNNPTPSCPASPGEVSGTLTAENVITRADQGVGPGDLAAVIEAIDKGVAYVNVHSSVSPSGAVRGQFHGKH